MCYKLSELIGSILSQYASWTLVNRITTSSLKFKSMDDLIDEIMFSFRKYKDG